MPPPPPPPPPPLAPPPPPPPPSSALPQCPSELPKLQSGGGGRNALLSDIQRGTRLRKVTQVADRSAPTFDKPKSNSGDVFSGVGASQGTSGPIAPTGPSLGGLFAGGFPVLRPIGQRDLLSVKTSVSRSSSSASLKPLWNPPMAPTDTTNSSVSDDHGTCTHRPLSTSSSTPPSPSYPPPPFPSFSAPPPTPPPPPAPPSSTPPPPPSPQALQDRPTNRPPPLPSCPPPPPPPPPAPHPPSQATKPTWLPLQHSSHHHHTHPSTPPPPPPPFHSPSVVPGDRSSGCFYSPPPPASFGNSETSRFPILRDSPLGPPPPPPLPASYAPSCPCVMPPPPPKVPPVPSPTMRSLPPSYPCNAPTRRPPAIPRSAGRMAPPPAPPARSLSTELSNRIPPPPPPPLPPSGLRNGHLHSLADDFESKFQFHPVEDLPPPDEFKPFPRIYPSKENGGNPKPPGMRTHIR